MIYLNVGNHAFLHHRRKRVPVEIVALAKDTYGITCLEPCAAAPGEVVYLEFPFPGGRALFQVIIIVSDTLETDSMILQRAGSKTYAQRRNSWRIPMHHRTTATFEDHDIFQGSIVNISKEGALFETTTRLELTSSICLWLPLEGIEERPVHARVLRKEPAGMFRVGVQRYGLIFQDLTTEAQMAITLYIWDQLRHNFPERLIDLFPGCSRSK